MSRTVLLAFIAAAIIPFVGILILNWESFSPSLNLNLNKKQTTLTPIPPTPTSLPKFISQSSCVVLDEAYCKTGQVVNYQGKFFGLAFKIPEGTKIYAPFNGTPGSSRSYFLDNERYPSLTIGYQPKPKTDADNIFFSALAFKTMNTNNNRVEKGEEIGVISTKIIDVFKDYNLIIRFERFNPQDKSFETDFNLFKKYFNYVQN